MSAQNNYLNYGQEPKQPPKKKSPQNDSVDFVLQLMLFIGLPVCGLIGLLAKPFLWAFLILSVAFIVFIWLTGRFLPRGRVVVSGLLAVLSVISLITLLGGTPSQTPDYNNFSVNGVPVSSATDQPYSNFVTAQPIVLTSPTPTSMTNTQLVDVNSVSNSSVQISQAQSVLEEYLNCWKTSDYENMVQYTTASWRTSIDSPSMQLYRAHGSWSPISWEISPSESYTTNSDSATFSVLVSMTRVSSGDIVQQRYSAILYNDPDGWRVDPDSLRSGIAVEATATPAPYTPEDDIPTPVPEPTTNPTLKLYYNTKGGSCYHLLQKCESINSKYYDSMASFTYSQLGDEPYSKLKPCSVCGAPERPAN